MKCTGRIRQYSDEMHCECGITWEVGEDKPPCQELTDRDRESRSERGKSHIKSLRSKYFGH